MKKIIALSAAAFLTTAVYAETSLQSQIDQLNKKLTKLQKKVGRVNAQAANDNIKWGVDYRTSVDSLSYTTANGTEYKNDALLSHRLWLDMGYAPTDNMIFHGQLAMNKAFGQTGNQVGTYSSFDWVNNETLGGDELRVREAYWLYKDNFGGLGVTASVGRRPATNGFLANLREGDAKAKSPMGHVINMEFDGASASVSTDDALPGMMFKLCLGRGVSNAQDWANGQYNYANQDNTQAMSDQNMYGFIFVPYNDGQYNLTTTWFAAQNMPGISTMGTPADMTDDMMMSFGGMEGMAVSLKVDGIGDGVSDFLDETTVFASYAQSKTKPDAGQAMLGSLDSETGSSIWAGIVVPNMTGGKLGFEYNQGDKYWRSFTYGEDTMIGSKLAARGNAIEAYWNQPLSKAFSMQVRYTSITYDYTGSNSFFGDYGASYSIDDAVAGGQDPVEKADDIRLFFRYQY